MQQIKTIPVDVAKTSLPQTWHAPRGTTIRGTEIDQVEVHGYNRKDPTKETKAIKSKLYNPIRDQLPPVEDLLQDIQSVFPTSLLLTCTATSDLTPTINTKFGLFPKGSPISYQQKLHSDYIINIYNAPNYPVLPVKNVMNPTYNIVLTQSQSISHSGIEVSIETSAQLEESTRLQSSNPKWHQLRYHRITASKAGEIYKRLRSKKFSFIYFENVY